MTKNSAQQFPGTLPILISTKHDCEAGIQGRLRREKKNFSLSCLMLDLLDFTQTWELN